MLLGIVGGVLADIFDRRPLLIVVQLALAAVGLALTVLTYLGEMPPALPLTFTWPIELSAAIDNPSTAGIHVRVGRLLPCRMAYR